MSQHPFHRAIGAVSHAIIDYAMVIFLVVGPSLVGFRGRQATLAYILAAVHFLLTVVTKTPLGVLKIVRFPLHGVIELLVGVVLLALPWLYNFFAGVLSRNFYFASGVLLLIIWALTDYRGVRDRVVADRATPPAPPAP